MDIAKSFTYMFEDTDWLRKLAIGTVAVLIGMVLLPVLIGLVPIIIVMGYALDVTRNVLDGRATPLPQWEDWSGFFNRGVKLAGVLFVWALPLIVIAIPISIAPAVFGNNRDLSWLAGLCGVCGACLSLLWGLLLALFSPALYVRMARTDRFASGFEFADLWAFTRANLSNVIVVFLMTILAGFIAMIGAGLGVIAIFIGLLVTVPLAILWQWLVQAHLYGQVGAHSVAPVA